MSKTCSDAKEAGATPLNGAVERGEGRSGRRFAVSVFAHWCKACGICMAFCPKGVFSPDAEGRSVVTRMEACVGCRFCELHCPDFAIAVKELEGGDHEQTH